MIGIVIPAHNEAACIDGTLAAAAAAGRHPALHGEDVQIFLVLDSCTDKTPEIAALHKVKTLETQARNVGIARALGAECALSMGARWLSFTDADTLVSEDWLVQQLALGADVVCGPVAVRDWSLHGLHAHFLEQHFARTYCGGDGHRHVHGANLGVSAAAYTMVGGFMPLACSEDVALVRALEHAGAHVAWSGAPRVHTSARKDARARGGFGDTLLAVIEAGGNPSPAHMELVARTLGS